MKERVVRCGNCKTELPETGSEAPEAREPCPVCGSTSRSVAQHLSTTLTLRSFLSLKHRPPKGRPVMDHKLGADLHVVSMSVS